MLCLIQRSTWSPCTTSRWKLNGFLAIESVVLGRCIYRQKAARSPIPSYPKQKERNKKVSPCGLPSVWSPFRVVSPSCLPPIGTSSNPIGLQLAVNWVVEFPLWYENVSAQLGPVFSLLDCLSLHYKASISSSLTGLVTPLDLIAWLPIQIQTVLSCVFSSFSDQLAGGWFDRSKSL